MSKNARRARARPAADEHGAAAKVTAVGGVGSAGTATLQHQRGGGQQVRPPRYTAASALGFGRRHQR